MLVALLTAVAAGALALLSPCAAPILPGVAAAVLGRGGRQTAWWVKSIQVASFAVGAALITVGSVAVVLIAALPIDLARQPFSTIAGIVLIVFALSNFGFVKIPWFTPSEQKTIRGPLSYLRPFILGMTCAAIWYPCLGPSLALTYTLASHVNTIPIALLLALAYFLGLAAPLLLIGVALAHIPATSRHVKRVGRIANFVVSGLLIVMGILLVSGLWLPVSTWLTTVFGQFVTL